MQHKELMTNSFPIALEKQIADDMEIFGSLSDDTERAIDCVNADTFCKPANLADIKSQVTAIAQTLTPLVSYDRATTIAFTTTAMATRVISSACALTKWTARSLQILALVAIGLGCMAFETWQRREKVKAAIKDQYLILCLTGAMTLQLRVVIPMKDLKARSRVAFTTMVNGLDY